MRVCAGTSTVATTLCSAARRSASAAMSARNRSPCSDASAGSLTRFSLERPNTIFASSRLCCSSCAMVSRCCAIVWRCSSSSVRCACARARSVSTSCGSSRVRSIALLYIKCTRMMRGLSDALPLQTLEQHLQLRARDLDPRPLALHRDRERALLETLVEEPEPVAVPHQQLHPVVRSIVEHEHVAREWVVLELVAHQCA